MKRYTEICSACGRRARIIRSLTLADGQDKILDYVFFCSVCWQAERTKIQKATDLVDTMEVSK